MKYQNLSISPMVLLSAVDHYKRQSYQRVVGILLGKQVDSKVIVTNSFAVPFEESENNFFLDTSYLINMFELFHKVNNKESIVGWYHTGPKLCKLDKKITKTIGMFCDNPALAIINVHLETEDIPVQAYSLGFDEELKYVNVTIGADENEEVGVEHLLRDIKATTGTTVQDRLVNIKNSIKKYSESLGVIIDYLNDIKKQNKLPNQEILKLLQEVLNEVPQLGKSVPMDEIYGAEMINALIAMNDLKRNQLDRE